MVDKVLLLTDFVNVQLAQDSRNVQFLSRSQTGGSPDRMELHKVYLPKHLPPTLKASLWSSYLGGRGLEIMDRLRDEFCV